MRVGVVVLVHEFNQAVCDLVRRLEADLTAVAIHVDANAKPAVLTAFRSLESENVHVLSAAKVGWGQWGMVSATLRSVALLLRRYQKLDYVGLISGSCYPIRNLAYLPAFFEVNPLDYIECNDIWKTWWVKSGLQTERLRWWFPFNAIKQPRRFKVSWRLQKFFRVERKLPSGYHYAIGSQWCFLRRSTWEIVLRELAKDKPLQKHMKYTWIPDESAIQTVVRTFVPEKERCSRNLCLYQFNHLGRPIMFYNGHEEILKQQGFFFARKLSPAANELRAALDLHGAKRTALRFSELGRRTDEMLRMGSFSLANKNVFPKLCGPAGAESWRGRGYVAIYASSNVSNHALEKYAAHQFKTHHFLGRLSGDDNIVLRTELNRHFDLGANARHLPHAFIHDIFALLIDHAEKPPVIVFDENCEESILWRAARDAYCKRVVVLKDDTERDEFGQKADWIIKQEKATFITAIAVNDKIIAI
jgi:hypothetical protein